MAKHRNAPGQRPGWCIHYRSPQFGETCSAGVRYDELRDGESKPKMDRSPCFIKPGQSAADRSPCEKLRAPTEREIAEYNDWKDGRVGHLMAALSSVSDWVSANKGKQARTVVPCPACGSDLHVVKAASNDHTRGQCSRDAACICWIQ